MADILKIKEMQFARFLIVGAIGFVVDYGILHGVTAMLGINLYGARCASFAFAVIVTWVINRAWTFSDRKTTSILSEYGRYIGVQTVGWLTNFLTYSALMRFVFGADLDYLFYAFCAGSAVGLIVNYTGAKYLVFDGAQRITP